MGSRISVLKQWVFIALVYHHLCAYKFVRAQSDLEQEKHQQQTTTKVLSIVYQDDGNGNNAGAGGVAGDVATPITPDYVMPHYRLPDSYQGYTVLIPALEEQARQWYEAQKQVDVSISDDNDDEDEEGKQDNDDDDDDNDDNDEDGDDGNKPQMTPAITVADQNVDFPRPTIIKMPRDPMQQQPAVPEATSRLIKKTRKNPSTERQTYRFPPGKVMMHVPPPTNAGGRIPQYKVGDIIYFAWSYMNIKTRPDAVSIRVYKDGTDSSRFYELASNASYVTTNIRWNTTELVQQDPRDAQGDYTLYIYNSIYSNPLPNVGIWKPGELGVSAAQKFRIVDHIHADQEPDVIEESIAGAIIQPHNIVIAIVVTIQWMVNLKLL